MQTPIHREKIRQLLLFAACSLISCYSTSHGQDSSNLLENGSFEEALENDHPKHWKVASPKGFEHSRYEQDAADGDVSLLIDSTSVANTAKHMVETGSQNISGKSIQGKRIRLTASVKTLELKGPARVQLFVNCSIPGEGITGMFTPTTRMLDDMLDRPIRQADDWQQHSIVVDVPEKASNLAVGWKIIGRGRVCLDDFVAQTVDASVAVTKASNMAPSAAMKRYQEKRKLINAAGLTAHLAQPQPFFTHWLWLAGFSLGLFFVAMYRRGEASTDSASDSRPDNEHECQNAKLTWKFAFRFTVIYWVLFLFVLPINGEFGTLAVWANGYYEPWSEYLIYGLAENVFGIEGKLTPPLGSGDTTYGYIHVLARFLVTIALTAVWSLVDWRKTNYRMSHDLLISFLRYSLAVSLLTYGLIKVQWSANQFPAIFESRMDQKWGDTSPMRLVWNFMGASRPYTIFAGLGELIAGLLLVFRRTSVVGTLAAVGVMTNVVMLNFCYDVPVKIFSVHLLVIGFMLLVASWGSIKSLLFMKPSSSATLRPPYYSTTTRWFYYPIKIAIVTVAFVMPCWSHFSKEVTYLTKQSRMPDWLADYSIEEFKIDGVDVDLESHPTSWKDVSLSKVEFWTGFNESDCIFTLMKGERTVTQTAFSLSESENQFTFLPSENPTVPQESCSVKVIDDERIMFSGTSLAGNIEALLKRKEPKKYLIRDRGFHWISEVPFNR